LKASKIYRVHYIKSGARVTIPKHILEQVGMPDYITIEVEDGRIVLRPVRVVVGEGQ